MPQVELRPCPFCGGEAFVNRYLDKNDGERTAVVECRTCHARCIPWVDLAHPDDETYTAWNRRAPSPEVSRLVEAVEWYASEERYHLGKGDRPSEAEMDEGRRARAALRAYEESVS